MHRFIMQDTSYAIISAVINTGHVVSARWSYVAYVDSIVRAEFNFKFHNQFLLGKL